ncbi:MAG: copper amine oxidase N-terminal domain-containing protein, partial [Clostridia bacterium]|nr:copper amine oxidase N-terminal domain-containing protein [Clostridia bacterium]
LDQDPVIVDNRTLVPARGVFEALGAMVEWKGETKQISVTTEDTTVVLTLNSQEYNVNGDLRQLDVPAQLMNDRTMIPLRAIGEALGCQVEWVDETKTAVITSNNQ